MTYRRNLFKIVKCAHCIEFFSEKIRIIELHVMQVLKKFD
jgi:hypothetical protein